MWILQVHCVLTYNGAIFKHLYHIHFSETGEKKRPVIIHRAILGSVERMIAILTESYAGKWPFWLSPRQCIVIPVGAPFNDYAFKVYKSIIVNCYSLNCNYVFLTNIKPEKNILGGREGNFDNISYWRVSPKLLFWSSFISFWSPMKCSLHKILIGLLRVSYNLLHIFVEVSHWRLSPNVAPSFIFTGVIMYRVANLSSTYPINRVTHFV